MSTFTELKTESKAVITLLWKIKVVSPLSQWTFQFAQQLRVTTCKESRIKKPTFDLSFFNIILFYFIFFFEKTFWYFFTKKDKKSFCFHFFHRAWFEEHKYFCYISLSLFRIKIKREHSWTLLHWFIECYLNGFFCCCFCCFYVNRFWTSRLYDWFDHSF